ncbi:hypothetical protein AVHY2522_22860 [Acidovorax sp. SUPP2522]|uniref:hypothetical protein n=1 Tax=unclassified Acidovorax TaxID=2684926 RepID=UPI0023491B11|nr:MULTISPECIES: hypothetical protein [unclassified Acidovorax]WCM95732.1 hypothetical protein M5C96_14715 [Acidovorax sp. GBBC 1281]GKT19543.1 hypothetical protein AVHY2522_22860 [Acidovorax sp. SUPP2522]
MLTIEKNALGELFLPALASKVLALDVLDNCIRREKGEAERSALCYAWAVVKDGRDLTVERIRERGGLLLIGGNHG